MKSVLISIRPKWCELIASGKKTMEVRKTRPKMGTPFKCYIYCTGVKSMNLQDYVAAHQATGGAVDDWSGKVIGEFVCDNIATYDDDTIFSFRYEDYARWNDFDLNRACIHPEDFQNYADGKWLYGWHISDLKIYDKPKELSEFAVADKEAIQQCEYREQSCYAFTDTGYIKNGFYCKKKDDWCFGECKRKALTRPPQSWCYVEELL